MPAVDLEQLANEAKKMPFWQAHRFWIMIVGALGIALFLVLVAMNLYNSSGTAQLDLSRPEYENVRDQVSRGNDTVAYPSSGEINRQSLDEFRQLFSQKANDLQHGNYYSPDAITDAALGIPAIDG